MCGVTITKCMLLTWCGVPSRLVYQLTQRLRYTGLLYHNRSFGVPVGDNDRVTMVALPAVCHYLLLTVLVLVVASKRVAKSIMDMSWLVISCSLLLQPFLGVVHAVCIYGRLVHGVLVHSINWVVNVAIEWCCVCTALLDMGYGLGLGSKLHRPLAERPLSACRLAERYISRLEWWLGDLP